LSGKVRENEFCKVVGTLNVIAEQLLWSVEIRIIAGVDHNRKAVDADVSMTYLE